MERQCSRESFVPESRYCKYKYVPTNISLITQSDKINVGNARLGLLGRNYMYSNNVGTYVGTCTYLLDPGSGEWPEFFKKGI